MLNLQDRTQANGHDRVKYQIAQPSARRTHTSWPNRSVLWGAGLIILGGLTLLAMLTNWSVLQMAILPFIAALLLVVGIRTRSSGLLVPAGILSGLSVGVILANLLEGKVSEDTIGGVVLVSLGVGFALVIALQALARTFTHWWPLIPAVFLAAIGVALMTQGQNSPALTVFGYIWPVALLALGVWLFTRGMRRGKPE